MDEPRVNRKSRPRGPGNQKWQTEFKKEQDGLLHTLRDDAEKALEDPTARINGISFPSFEKINQDAQESKDYFANFASIERPGNQFAQPNRQKTFEFSQARLRRSLEKLWGVRHIQQPIVVFAGHTGECSQRLAHEGLTVIHTDPDTRFSKTSGIESQTAMAHEIQMPENAQGMVSFEGYPALQGSQGYLTYLKALAETEKGLVMIHGNKMFESATERSMQRIAAAYNAQVRKLNQPASNASYLALLSSPKVRKKASLDWTVLKHIQQGPASIEKLARVLHVSESLIRKSLIRIHAGYGHGKGYEPHWKERFIPGLIDFSNDFDLF